MKKVVTLSLAVILFFANNHTAAQKSYHVTVTGSGQPVFLFPGFACPKEVFTDVINELKKHYQVHAFTFAGFGDVPAVNFPWLRQIKSDVETYRAQNHLENVILIGHSLGGTLGLWLTSDDSRHYSKLIAIDALPAMGALMMPDYDSSKLLYDNPYNQQLLTMNNEAFNKMTTQMSKGMAHDSTKQAQIAAWMNKTDRKTFVYGYTDLLKLDLRNDLRKIQAPVVVLGATEPFGKDIAKQTFMKQYKNLKNFELHLCEGSRHFIMFDQPLWLMNQIKTELALP